MGVGDWLVGRPVTIKKAVTAFAAKHQHIGGLDGRNEASGMLGAAPRMRRSIAELAPARKPMQIVCRVMIVGKASMDSPRIQALRSLPSTNARNASMGLSLKNNPGSPLEPGAGSPGCAIA